jgi:hypothetical protein
MHKNCHAAIALAGIVVPLVMGAISGCNTVVILDDNRASTALQGSTDPQGPTRPRDPTRPESSTDSRDPSAAPACGPELHLIGVYESHSGHSGSNHPQGAATVHVERQGAMVLALSSYEPIHWTVTAAPGVVLEKVILNGYHDQTAAVPAGVPVEIFSGPEGSLGAYAYAWPSAEGGSNTSQLVSAVEKVSGRELSSFHGCYRASSFTLLDDLNAKSNCAVDAGYELDSYTSPAALKGCGDDPAEP